MADHNLGTIRGTIRIDYDGAGVARATRDTENLSKTNQKLDKTSSSVLKSFTSFGKGALKFGGAISTANSAAGLLAGTLSVLGPLTAAGLAAAPALIAGYASAMIVAKVATAGVGDALSAASGDAKKFDESIKGLAPNARAFAQAFKTSLPALKSVQQSMQNAFFKGSAQNVAGVVKGIASLKPQATAVAGSLGQVAQNIVKTATSGKNINNLKGILSGVNAFLKQIKSSIGPVVTGFLGLAKQGAAFGKSLGTSVSGQLDKLSKFLATIDLKKVFADAAPIVKGLGTFLSDVANIAKNLFGIFVGGDGESAVGVLTTLTSTLRNFLNSAAGQEALTALGTAMSTIGGATGQVFLTLLQALAPAIVALAPGAGQLATQFSGVLVSAITTLNPLLQGLAGFLSDNMGWLGPLAGAIYAASAAYKGYAAAAGAVKAAQAALNSSMVVSTAAWVRNTAAVVANRVASAATAVVVGVQMAAAWALSTAAMLLNKAGMVASTVAMYAVRAAVIAWTAAQWLLDAALNANPLSLVVIAIAAFVAAIVIAYNKSETFRNIVTAAWNGIKAAVSAVADWFTGTLWPGIQAVWNGIASGLASLKAKIGQIWTSIKSAISSAWSAIVGVVRSGVAKVKSVIAGVSAIIQTIKNAFTRAKTAAQTAMNTLVSFVKDLPRRFVSGLGNIGSLLYEKGKTLIQGFINGIKSMIGKVSSVAKSAVSAVTKWLPGSPAEVGPLSGKGYVLLRAQRFVDDFAKGIDSKQEVVNRAVGRMAETTQAALGMSLGPASSSMTAGSKLPASIRRTLLAGSPRTLTGSAIPSAIRGETSTKPSTSSGSSSSGSSSSGTNTYVIKIGTKTIATLVTDNITGHPITVAKAAKAGNQKLGWSGSGR